MDKLMVARVIPILTTTNAVPLSGCLAMDKSRRNSYKQHCTYTGFEPGPENHAMCTLELEKAHIQADAQRPKTVHGISILCRRATADGDRSKMLVHCD